MNEGWYAMQESNLRHAVCNTAALASELIALVEMTGLEPATPCLQSRRTPSCATSPGGDRGNRTLDFRVANAALSR